jgi:Big-like domain-containing protein
VAPSAGSTVSGSVPFTAQSSSSVVWVNYYIDGGYVWSSPSYTYNWNSTASGSGAHSLTVKGYDGSGNQVAQDSISVTVGGSSGGGSSGGSGPAYFSLQTVGAQLPTGDQCAQWVHSQGGSETQSANAGANQTTPTASELQSFHSNPTFIADLPSSDYANIDGNFTGTTIQIIRWASCKWGIDENAMKAQAWEESSSWISGAWYIWSQGETGDWRTDPSVCQAGSWYGWTGSGCWQSFGIYQEKPLTWNIWPEVRDSTAFNADFRGGYLRACINGDIRGLDNGYPYGDTYTRLWGCMGEWYSGHWYDSGANYYIGLVQNWVNTLPWQ